MAVLDGAGSLAVSLVASVSRAGSRVALCGVSGFGMAAALEQGADPERIALVEGPLADPVSVASILLDGADVVLCALGGIAVPPSRGRAIAARARTHGSILLVTGGRWDGASLHLGARVRGYTGLGSRPGRGRIRGIDLVFSARGRGCANPQRGAAPSAGLAVAGEHAVALCSCAAAAHSRPVVPGLAGRRGGRGCRPRPGPPRRRAVRQPGGRVQRPGPNGGCAAA
ncbi:hypothetical protein MTP03_38090 [Tsukamurella sp. PLM1]|nr:hypothetical protein MTP03_38090 [Tsukamurella sp. PLM1]